MRRERENGGTKDTGARETPPEEHWSSSGFAVILESLPNWITRDSSVLLIKA